MKTLRHILLCLATAATLASCIKNDVPLPVIIPKISAFEAEGCTGIDINSDSRTITLMLQEQTDPRLVNITKMEVEPATTKCDTKLEGWKDLSKGLDFTLTIYQNYHWHITVQQPIERFFAVEGQVGSASIDDVNKRAIVSVKSDISLSQINITDLKLGPADVTTYVPRMEEMHNLRHGQTVKVTYFGKTEEWTLWASNTTTVVEMDSVDPWTRVAWLSATGIAGQDNGFMYRKTGSAQWIKLDASKIAIDGGAFKGCVEDLEPLTDYECYAYSGNNATDVFAFSTEEERQMPNSSFETFSHAESNNYFSFFDPASSVPELQSMWWGSGNEGSTKVGASASITDPDGTEHRVGDYSVKMTSKYVVIKFAAGNIFTGSFGQVIGVSGGSVYFGRPWTLRPRKLRLWVKYTTGPIDHFGGAPDNDPTKLGDNDRCQVFIALGDWAYSKYGGTKESPVMVDTTDKSTFFKPKAEAVIGYGCYTSNETFDWKQIEIPIEYTSTSRIPTHIIVSCAGSMLGDYFTGSTSSRFWVDGMELVY